MRVISPNIDLRAQLLRVLEDVRDGRLLAATERTYSPRVRVRVNQQPPVTGLRANLEARRSWLETVAAFQRFDVRTVAAGDGVTMCELALAWTDTDGVHRDGVYVSIAHWADHKIVHEQIYEVSRIPSA